MFRNLTTTYPDEILKQKMLEGGDPAKVNFLFPTRTGHELPPGALQLVVPRCRRSPTRGPLPARTQRRENPSCRVICIWSLDPGHMVPRASPSPGLERGGRVATRHAEA